MTEQRSKEPIHHKVGCPQFPNQWDDPSGPCTCGAESAAREKTVVVSSKTPYEHHYSDHAELVRRLRDVVPNEVTPVGEMWNLIEEAADEIDRLSAENQRLREALRKVGDDYPGSSCQQWCYERAKEQSP